MKLSVRHIPFALTALLLSGCGGVVRFSDSITTGATFQGRVHGGQQPVFGAAISLYAAGVGTVATNLLGTHNVTTDQYGSFTITGDYTCPSATTQVYLVAQGGNPGLAAGTNNAALTMMAALGDCGALTANSYVYINEITTAASVWALSRFLGPGANIAASATNATGLRNAFLSVQNLVNNATGAALGPALPAGATTEPLKLATLANVLATCVNSNGGAACAPLFSAATAGSTPANTLDAARNIVGNPAANVVAVFNVAPAQAPFQSALKSAPNDWTMSITYAGGGLNQPGNLAVDSVGNIWAANYFGAVVSKFLPTGAAAAPGGYPGTGLRQSFGIAVDPQDHVWVSNETSVTGAANSHLGSLSKFDNAGNELSGFGYTVGGIYYPQGIASDPAGDIWVADYGRSSASLLANDGSALSPANGYGASALPFTSAVAIDSSANAWFAVQQAAVRVTPAGVVTNFPCCNDPAGVAVDDSGDIWLADYGAAALVELTPLGAVAARIQSANGTNAAQGIAVDGAGHVFAANYRGNSITEVAVASAATLSPLNGFGLDAPLNDPLGIAIDASGNLWIANAGGNTLTEFLGLAGPIKMPMSGPPSSP